MPLCTCDEPPCVDLTRTFEEDVCDSDSKTRQQQVLLDTLKRWGWCHVSVNKSEIPQASPLQFLSQSQTKVDIEGLYRPEFLRSLRPSNCGDVFSTKDGSATYRGRTAESGDSSASKPEPKQSWETKRCRRSSMNDGSKLQLLHRWTEALHYVAVMVTRLLDIPANVLIKEDSCNCQTNKRTSQDCNVDLLRVFYYDAVEDPKVLGSSPHTDWGGWTVVWQDHVGGLQTFCPLHERWVDVNVAATTKEQEREGNLYFVVHVGDVTSLAMGRAARRQSSLGTGAGNTSQKGCDGTLVWPSPRHQVVCPTTSVPRASLVYFAYPPPGVSLQEMEEELVEWWNTRCQNDDQIDVMYDHYSLLQNQSMNGVQSSAQSIYENIKARPLQEVFSDKWQQVQRT